MLLDYTPIELFGKVYIKREDKLVVNGVCGSKVRTCLTIAETAIEKGAGGITSACLRTHPQVPIVAGVAEHLGIRSRIHMPSGKQTNEMLDAIGHGAEIIQHLPGYRSVVSCRAKGDAKERGWPYIPFNMEAVEAIIGTAKQVRSIPNHIKRIVVCVGSGMTLAGILQGLLDTGRQIEVKGVIIGADPTKQLDRFAPFGWQGMCELVESELTYKDKDMEHSNFHGLELDTVYEAKCVPFLSDGDLFWVIGKGPNYAGVI